MIKRIIIGKSPRRTFKRAAILLVVSFFLFRFILLPVRITGISMEPTYGDGSINFVNTLRYKFRQPERGDIVAIILAGRRIMLLKRVVGLPGERLMFRDGNLIVNGHLTPEPYLKNSYHWTTLEVEINSDEFFVVGDNRQMPPEAHQHGRVKRYKIIGGPLF